MLSWKIQQLYSDLIYLIINKKARLSPALKVINGSSISPNEKALCKKRIGEDINVINQKRIHLQYIFFRIYLLDNIIGH